MNVTPESSGQGPWRADLFSRRARSDGHHRGPGGSVREARGGGLDVGRLRRHDRSSAAGSSAGSAVARGPSEEVRAPGDAQPFRLERVRVP
jgi:hypothetical protein